MIISGYGLLLLFTSKFNMGDIVTKSYTYLYFFCISCCFSDHLLTYVLCFILNSDRTIFFCLICSRRQKIPPMIRKSVVKEASLLDSRMGTAVMEDRIRNKVEKITREQKLVLYHNRRVFRSSLGDLKIRQFVDIVIQEVKMSRQPK